ncbi:MAG: gliding motility-associated ABC transporter permease subunit GldF [Bacteroidales bacterium]
MWTIFKKELNSFLTSLIGYITIFVFLIINGLVLWVLHVGVNIFDSAIASLNGLFFISPWVFLFLISAITMRMFAEEKRNGTIEILLTKPVSDISIIMGKFFASLVIVILSVLPTMVYMICIYQLGSPVGNLDMGGILGSYIGLVFLGGIFVSIGIFCSSLTNNQIVAFIISIIGCLIVYIGFETIAKIPFLSKFDLVVASFGISQHYYSISRGVIDLRDILYFISATAFFILLTKVSLESRNWKK